MAQLEITAQPAVTKENRKIPGDISGLIDMKSKQINGFLLISFSKQVILKITQNMLGEQIDQIDETVTDLVGEVTNMVTGGAKASLEELGYDFDLARPQVIIGNKQDLECASGSKQLLVPFQSEFGDLCFEICFSPGQKAL